MLKHVVLLQFHSISVFFLCVIVPHKSKWIEHTKQMTDHNNL